MPEIDETAGEDFEGWRKAGFVLAPALGIGVYLGRPAR